MTQSVLNVGFSDVDATADAGSFVRHLDRMTASEQVHASKLRTYAQLELCAGNAVLDVGCGPGDDTRALMDLVGRIGRVVGVDKSVAMIAEAQQRADRLHLPIEYYLADACTLPFRDSCFDACRMDRVLHHLEEPRLALTELVRVVRPGGRIVLHEPDFELLALDSPNRSLTRRLLNFFCDHVHSGWAGRQLYGLARRAGLVDLEVQISAWTSTDYAEVQQLMRLEATVAQATEMGVASAEEASAWLDGLRAASEDGTFYWASMAVLLSGRKRRADSSPAEQP